jgi:hypothetical protein
VAAREALATALHALAARIGHGDPFVLAVASPDAAWAPLLPFAIESTSLFLLAAEAVPPDLELGSRQERFGPLLLARGKVGDRRIWVVLEAGSPGRTRPRTSRRRGQSNSAEAAS